MNTPVTGDILQFAPTMRTGFFQFAAGELCPCSAPATAITDVTSPAIPYTQNYIDRVLIEFDGVEQVIFLNKDKSPILITTDDEENSFANLKAALVQIVGRYLYNDGGIDVTYAAGEFKITISQNKERFKLEGIFVDGVFVAIS